MMKNCGSVSLITEKHKEILKNPTRYLSDVTKERQIKV